MLDFAPFLMDAGGQVRIRPEEGTQSCLRGRLGTQTYLGRFAQVAGTSFVRVSLELELALGGELSLG